MKALHPCRRINAARRAGAAATELAILLPFILLMFFIAVDFARVFCYGQTLQNSAAVAALSAAQIVKGSPAVDAEQAAVQAAMREAASLNPPLKEDQITVQYGAAAVSVTIEYEFRTVIQCLGIDDSYTIVRTVTYPRAPGTEG